MPLMRRAFQEYNFVYNHNFRELINMCDNGIGMNHNWMRFNGMQFERHHQQAKRQAVLGLGVPANAVHALNSKLTDAATLSMDVTQYTLGRIPLTRAGRQAGMVQWFFFVISLKTHTNTGSLH